MNQSVNYITKATPTWCPGCGNFSVLTALRQSLTNLNIPTHEAVLITGIGCGTLMPYWVKNYGFNTLHGRPIPVATGVKIANHNLKVIVNSGDGDCLGIGMGHFTHFFRRNLDISVLMNNNGVYGLTKGQTAPTAKKGTKTSSTPFGSLEDYVNGAALALTMGATFVARAYAGDIKNLSKVLQAAIAHKGSSFVDVLDPCVTFNKVETYQFYNTRVKYIGNEVEPICKTRKEAYEFATKLDDTIPTGVIFQEEQEIYEEQISQFTKGALVDHDLTDIDVNDFINSRF